LSNSQAARRPGGHTGSVPNEKGSEAAEQPGRSPEVPPTAGTLFAALHGGVAPRGRSALDHDEHDAYQLFHDYSQAMGWLDDRSIVGGPVDRQHLAPGLWGMNDAGWVGPHASAEPQLLSWFQVEASAVPADRPLPVQPLLHCAERVTAHLGVLDLHAVHVLVPVQGLASAPRTACARVPGMLSKGWFTGSTGAPTPVRFSLNSGQDPVLRAAAPDIVDRFGRLEQEVFLLDSHEVTEDVDRPVPLEDSAWNGPPEHSVVLHGRLIEWSCDAIGWLMGVLGDVAALSGVRTPLLMTARREERS